MTLCNVLSNIGGYNDALCPKFRFSGGSHACSASGTAVFVPLFYAVAATVETQATNDAVERGGGVANDSSDDERLESVAVETAHHDDVLPHETASFIDLCFVGAASATIFINPCHVFCRNRRSVLPRSRSRDGG